MRGSVGVTWVMFERIPYPIRILKKLPGTSLGYFTGFRGDELRGRDLLLLLSGKIPKFLS